MSLILNGEDYPPQWDGYTAFLDQSSSGLDVDLGTANWLASGHMSDSSASEVLMHNAMGSVYEELPSSISKSSPDKTGHHSPRSSVTSIPKTDSLKPNKKPKGRPKIDLGSSQSVAEVGQISLVR